MTITTVPQKLLPNNQNLFAPIDSLQYRAIGRIWGHYVPSAENIRKGQLITTDGVIINVNLMNQMVKLVAHHLDLSSDYLWTAYPKTPHNDLGIGLYLSLISVKVVPNYTESIKTELQSQADIFSIQGEVIYQDFELGIVTVKIRRTPRRVNDNPSDFKLKLLGFLPPKSAGHFWHLYVQRVGTNLVIQSGECIKFMRQKQSKAKKLSTPSSENNHESVSANSTPQITESV